jgi:NTP pyrophosphatase (non-canonical NTP hydrolase)
MRPFNQLSPAQAERLAMLIEEAGEVIQAATKVLRHGYSSYHPDDPQWSNRELLQREIRDLLVVLELMANAGDRNTIYADDVLYEKAREKKLRYTHHQNDWLDDGVDPIRVALGRAYMAEQTSAWRQRREDLDEAMRLYLEEAQHG